MSNVKSVHIDGVVPFNWLQPDFEDATNRRQELASKLAIMCLSPTSDISIKYNFKGYKKNNLTNGQTAMYSFSIRGQEAYPFSFFRELYEDMLWQGAVFHRARIFDIEAGDFIDLMVDDEGK